MDAGKGKAPARCHVEADMRRTHFARIDIRPALQTHFLVEKQIAARSPLAYQQRCIAFLVLGVKAAQINIAQDVYIMKQNRSIRLLEKSPGFFQATTCIQQFSRLVRYVNAKAVITLLQMMNKQLGKMMNIDNDMLHAEKLHSFKYNVYQRPAGNRYKRFGHFIC